MKKPREKKVYANLILTSGYSQDEALKRLVLGILGFGTILGDKVQTSVFDPVTAEHELTLPTDSLLQGWLAVDEHNRQMVDQDMVEHVVTDMIEKLKAELGEQQEKAEKAKNAVN